MVTPLGGDVETTWTAAVAGRSGIRELTLFDATGLPCRIGGEVDDAWLPPDDDAHHGGRPFRLVRPAAEEAARAAGLADVRERDRIAVVLGGHANSPSLPDLDLLSRNTDERGAVDLPGLSRDRSYGAHQFMRRRCDLAPALLARMLDARGPSIPIVSACAAGGQAVGEGMRLLREGRADVVVAGGTECQLNYSAFIGCVLLGALAKRYPSPEKASRPFDRRRTGFVMSEGSAILVLETLPHARARRRALLGEVLGYGDSSDGFRITDMHPEGDGAVLAMASALRDAGVLPEEVGYVNAHGTSTPLNDPTETHAIKRVLGDHARRVPVSSNKSMLGHSFGAAGAIEAVLTLKGMAEGVVLPTINYEVPDPRCDLDYVPNEARAVEHRVALSNSFGFGGQNASLCLGAAP
jgi:3-oxoacyl-[acyl-carrier-protein] synthase II